MDTLKVTAKRFLRNSPALYRPISLAYRSLDIVRGIGYLMANRSKIMMGARPVLVSYPGDLSPRWLDNSSGHPQLAKIIGENSAAYGGLVRSFGPFRSALDRIPDTASFDSSEPCWNNNFFNGIDATALYGILSCQRPRRYFEIGSGYSTKFARRAIRDQNLTTTLLSIDPSPQASIDALCDTVIRQRLEDLDVSIFDLLEAGDVLFFDGSHHAFMSSDVVVFWLEILPRLRPGVLVHIHDIFLPFDYPAEWTDRYYSEQYLVAVALAAPQRSLDVVFPALFVQRDPVLSRLVEEFCGPRAMSSQAGSFWVRTRPSIA